jgi:GT2 family glycosyltransferase
MSAQPTVSAVVVNHNSGETILNTLRALIRQEYPLSGIIVVDNGSSADEVTRIREAFPQVKMIETGENLGPARARNLGLAQATGSLVLFLDDDVYLQEQALEKLVSALRQTGCVAACPRILLYPENSVIQCDGAGVHFVETLILRHSYRMSDQIPAERVQVNGFVTACLLIDRKTLAGLDGFDEDYFFYFEDLELSHRLRALGHTIFCEPQAVALHDRGQGTAGLSFRGAGDYPTRRAYLNLRQRWLTMLLHYQLRSFIILFPALFLYETAAFFETVRRGWLGLWFKAAFSLLSELPAILQRRQRWQRLRRLPDRDIITGGPLPFAPGFALSGRIAGAIKILNGLLNAYWDLAKSWL